MFKEGSIINYKKAIVILTAAILVLTIFLPSINSVNQNLQNTDIQTDEIIQQKNNDQTTHTQIKETLGTSGPWWNGNWNHYKEITIENDYIDNPLTNFPVLIAINQETGAKCNDGNSIRFIDTDNNTEYYYEIEEWNGGSGNSFAWVNIPTIASDSDTKILMYYNNSAASDNQSIENVWDNNYVAVYHMNDNTTSDILDSTSSNYDGAKKSANDPQEQNGKIGKAQDYNDGVAHEDYIQTANYLNSESECTVETWLKSEHCTDDDGIIYKGGHNTQYPVFFWRDESATDHFAVHITDDDVDKTGVKYSGYDAGTSGSWVYVAFTFKGNTLNGLRLYVDGNEDTTGGFPADTTGVDEVATQSEKIWIGDQHTATSSNKVFDGIIDEVRISTVERNSSWIKTSYHSTNQTTGFLTWSTEYNIGGWLNSDPVNSNPVPSNSTTNQLLNPTLTIKVTDVDYANQTVNVTFRTNATGSWGVIGTNSSVSLTADGVWLSQTNSSMDSYSTKYWWNVNTSDGHGGWDNDTYSFTTRPAPASWWNTDWLYRKEIIINHTKVQGTSSLINFPVLIDITSADLVGHAQSDGDDIVFTDYNGDTLNHEIEHFDNSNGELVCWVNVTDLSDISDTIVYLYYGNLGCGNQENVSGVWTSGFKSIWHLHDDLLDSTSNNNGTNHGTTDISGKIADAEHFDGNDYINATEHYLGANANWTASFWFKSDSTSTKTYHYMISTGEYTENGAVNIFQDITNGRLRAKIVDGNGNTTVLIDETDYLDDEWHLVHVIWNASSHHFSLYVDSVEEISATDTTIKTGSGTSKDLYIGNRHDLTSDRYHVGEIDEIRILDTVKSAEWISTEYTNQFDPSSFYMSRSEESIVEEPLFSNEIPENRSIDVSLTPILQVNVKDYQNDQVEWWILSNASGVWNILENGTLPSGDGTVSTSNTSVMSYYDTVYWWSVNATDPIGSGNWTNKSYWFKTKETISVSDPYPSDGVTDISLTPTLHVMVNQSDGYQMNISWKYNDDSTWYEFGSNSSVLNGTYYQTFSNATSLKTIYEWRVEVNDGHGNWNNKTYSFTTSEREKVSDNGIFEYLNKPCAVYYEGVYNRTYIGFVDNAAHVKIKYYDHDEKSFSDEVQVATVDSANDHGAPSLLVLQNGKIIVFYHNVAATDMFCKISTYPENITSWSSQIVVDNDGRYYPQPFQNSSGDVNLIYTHKPSATYGTIWSSVSEDNGSTWNTPYKIIDFGGQKYLYTALYQEQNNQDYIHVCMMFQNFSSGKRTNIYYMYTDDGGDTWKEIGDTPLSLPIDANDMPLILDEENIRIHDIYADANHHPFILYARYITTNPTLYMLFYNGTNWSNEEITEVATFCTTGTSAPYTTGACIDRKDSWVTYVSAENGSYSDIQTWARIDGSWRKTEDVTTGAHDFKIRPMPVYNRSDEMAVLWSNGTYITANNFDTEIHYTDAYILVTNIPIVYNESPSDGASDVVLQPILSALVNDTQGDIVDWWILSNASGSWQILEDGTLLDGNGTVSTGNTSAMNSYDTMYWWSVNCTDPLGSGNWTNHTYRFSTRLENYPPLLSNPYPDNGATDVLLTTVLSINISDSEGDSMNITFSTNASSSWEIIGINNSVGNGSYQHSHSFEGSSTKYWWSVNATDGNMWNNMTYSFSTMMAAPVVSNLIPIDGAIGVNIDLTQLSFNLSDPTGDNMSYKVETTPDIGSGNKSNIGDGFYSIDVSDLSYGTLYNWFVNVTDGMFWTNRSFTFITEYIAGGWWHPSWIYRKEITIDHALINNNLYNFPILIDLLDVDMVLHMQMDGDDIAFTDYYGNQLSHEIEYFNSSSGELLCWVNVTSLSRDSDTVLYMYYGNPGCSNQENVVGVWDSSFYGVWHLEETSGGTNAWKDSTSYGHHGTDGNMNPVESETSFDAIGQIDGAVLFDGVDDFISTSLYPDNSTRTISYWVLYDNLSGLQTIGCHDANDHRLYAGIKNGSLYWGVGDSYKDTVASGVSSGVWHYLTVTADGSNAYFYIDGFLKDVFSYIQIGDSSESFHIGCKKHAATNEVEFVNGVLDEIRVSYTDRNNSWITTCYNNQNDPSSFYSIGVEEMVTDAPMIFNEIPENGASNVELEPILSAAISDIQDDSVNWWIKSNVSSIWQILENGTLPDSEGIISTNNTSLMNEYNTTYWWSINTTDPSGSGNWTNLTLSFNTRLENYPPNLSSPSPGDGDSGVHLNPKLSIYANDLDGDLMNITFMTNASGSWQIVGTNVSVNNGTYSQISTGMNALNTTYWWSVNTTDPLGSGNWTNHTYNFTIRSDYFFMHKWTVQPGSSGRGARAADLNNDGVKEVVKAYNGGVAALWGSNGSVIWIYSDSHISSSSVVSIVDLTNDSYPEVLVTLNAAQGGLLVLHGNNGSFFWKRTDLGGHNMPSQPVVFDINNDGFPTIFTASMTEDTGGHSRISSLTYDGQLNCYNDDLWWDCWGGLSLMDYNNDGHFEIYLGDNDPTTSGDWIKSFWAENLTLRWKIRRNSDPYLEGSANFQNLIDVTGDGIRDLVVTTRNPSQTGRYGIAVLSAEDGSIERLSSRVLCTYGPYVVYDIDHDGHLEAIGCGDVVDASNYLTVFDLVDWSLEADIMVPDGSRYSPTAGDVTGDGLMEIIVPDGNYLRIFNSTYYQIALLLLGGSSGDSVNDPLMPSVQDLDNDGLNEIVVTRRSGHVIVYDTDGISPQKGVRSGLKHYSEYRLGAAEYVTILTFKDEQPQRDSTGAPLNPTLYVNATNYQDELMDITFRTNASGTWQTIIGYNDVGNGIYTALSLDMNDLNTLYWWSVNATDRYNTWTNMTYCFTTVIDVPPEIMNVTASPHSQVIGGNVNITCDVTDNVQVDVVKVNITHPGGETINETANTSNVVGGGWTVLTYDDFEGTGFNWGNYTDGGDDCLAYTDSTYAHQGYNAVDIQDDNGAASSFYHTSGIDIDTPGYKLIMIDFWFYANGMESGEDFWVRYYDGAQWHTIADYASGDEFENGQFYHEIVWINEADYTFPSDMKIRFQCDASHNYDDIYIDEIYVNATTGGSGSYYYNTTYITSGPYNFVIWANDTSGNSNMSTGHSFTIQDTTPPEITDNTIGPAYTSDSFTFNTSVTDNIDTPTVYVEYWYGSGSHTNMSMTATGIDDYFEHTITTADSTDVLYYIISANDTIPNWNNTGQLDVGNVIDNDLPEITTVVASPATQETGGYVNISCDVGDNVDVDEVWVNITYPDSSTQNHSMQSGSYYYNNTYDQVGTNNYFIWANDTSGNSNMSTGHSFTIQDTTPPEITDNTIGPAYTSDSFTFNTSVTDNIDTPTVYVEYWYGSGSHTNMSMTATGIDDYFEHTITTADSTDVLYYIISANDTIPNWNNTGQLDVGNVIDNDLPEITTVVASPATQETGGYVNISCDVGDNVDVDEVWVNITYPDSSTQNHSMQSGSYYYNNTYDQVGTYDFFIWTNDTSDNIGISSIHHFYIYILEYNYSVPLDEEWNLVSLPVNQSIHKNNITVNYLGVNYSWQQAVDNDTILGFIYGWNVIGQSYVPTDFLQPGEAYWMYAYDDCNLWVTVNDSNSDDYITDLSEEWNLVGLPYDTAVDKENLTVHYNSTDYTWQQAVDNDTILGFIYGWNVIGQSYVPTDALNPGSGYWMYAYYNCTLFRPET